MQAGPAARAHVVDNDHALLREKRGALAAGDHVAEWGGAAVEAVQVELAAGEGAQAADELAMQKLVARDLVAAEQQVDHGAASTPVSRQGCV